MSVLRALRARWIVVAVCVVLAGVAGWLSASATPVPVASGGFRATAQLLSTGTSSQVSGISVGVTNLNAIAALATNREVAARAVELLGTEEDPAELASQVQSSADVQSGLVDVTATADDRQDAKMLADSFANALVQYLQEQKSEAARDQARAVQRDVDDLEEDIAALNAEINAVGENSPDAAALVPERDALVNTLQSLTSQHRQLLIKAQEPVGMVVIEASATPVSTGGFQPPRSELSRTALSALIGLLGGIGLALLIERLRARVRSKEEAESLAGLPVLAEIPKIKGSHRREIAVVKEPSSPAAEAFRLLDSGLSRAVAGRQASASRRGNARAWPQTVLVTSAEPGDGKSTVVANLAAASSEVGRRVVVLSCDFRHSGLRPFFNGVQEVDLSRALATGDLSALFNGNGNILPTPSGEIRVIDSSPAPGRSRELLSSEPMRRVLADARKHADVVLIDTPPLVTAGEVAPLLNEADAVLLVTRIGRTTIDQARRAGELLALLQAPAVGVVLNGSRSRPFPRSYFRVDETPSPDDHAATGDDLGDDAAESSHTDAGDSTGMNAAEGPATDERGYSPTSVSSDG